MPLRGSDAHANTSDLRCCLHHTIDDVPDEDWRAIVDERCDLAMDRRLLAVQQRAFADQCRMWFAVIRARDSRPQAVAGLCLFNVDGVISARPLLQRGVGAARLLHPNLLRYGVLFCGLPIPAGESHLRCAHDADVFAVMRCLHATMGDLAKRCHAALIVVKELDSTQMRLAQPLLRKGYHCGGVPPMFRLRGTFTRFDHFASSMRSSYRAQIRRSQRRLCVHGVTIEHHACATRIAQNFTPDLHELYAHVWRRSRYKLEWVPRSFFIDAATALDGETALTILRAADRRPLAFAFSMQRARQWRNLYVGVDHAAAPDADLLFNVFYADLAAAFERGCDDILLGQTSDAFKARLGAVPQPLQFLVRARSPLTNASMRVMAPILFPTLHPSKPHRVFRSNGQRPAAPHLVIAKELTPEPAGTAALEPLAAISAS